CWRLLESGEVFAAVRNLDDLARERARSAPSSVTIFWLLEISRTAAGAALPDHEPASGGSAAERDRRSDAILDRLVHNAHHTQFKGESLREQRTFERVTA
ncbi:MAG: hypothetical protein ACJ8D1_10595, partial [Microvirga sp.]